MRVQQWYMSTGLLPLILMVAAGADWPMCGANPQRTGWAPEGTPIRETVKWETPLTPFIPHKAQIIAVGDLVYVSTADGVYALHFETGDVQWHFRTPMPVGHSPTVVDGVCYFGCYDRKIYAVDAVTGNQAPLWSFTGGKGFDNNPLVVDGRVYSGCRDGKMYCLNASSGQKIWEYDIGRPISFSPAYGDGKIYFAGHDGRAYALHARAGHDQDGRLCWQSDILPGRGFSSFWPVVHGGRVLFSGSHGYGVAGSPYEELFRWLNDEAWPVGAGRGDPLGPHLGGGWYDASTAVNYFTAKPYRKTFFVLDPLTGKEREILPYVFQGNEGTETCAPPVVGSDSLAYMIAGMILDPKFGISFCRTIGFDIAKPTRVYQPYERSGEAIDKPGAVSAGGDYIYVTCGRGSKLIYSHVGGGGGVVGNPVSRSEYKRFKYGMAEAHDTHGIQNAPIPFRGNHYVHRCNRVVCF